jgi:hypothetical protein
VTRFCRDNEPMKILMLCCGFMVQPCFVVDDVVAP